MDGTEEIVQLLREIRDNQREAIAWRKQADLGSDDISELITVWGIMDIDARDRGFDLLAKHGHIRICLNSEWHHSVAAIEVPLHLGWRWHVVANNLAKTPRNYRCLLCHFGSNLKSGAQQRVDCLLLILTDFVIPISD